MSELLEGVEDLVRRALDEDAAEADVTTQALVGASETGAGVFLVKAGGVLAGLPVAEAVFHAVDPSVAFQARAADGQRVRRRHVVATIEGPLASLLVGERVALNFLQRLSGIATLTARYVRAVRGTGAEILDTRKTTPGLRRLEKYAVRMGGGRNHRMDLSDAVLIKDNHLAAIRAQGLTIKDAVRRARSQAPPGITVEVEVTSVDESREAVDAGVDVVLLDNMGLDAMRRAVLAARGKARTEASGGITLSTVRAVAETGVDFISVGALTHSAKALDISLEIEGHTEGVAT
ncbi:MAG: carboxylating nicotinate-nucleotide diphosphorylase [Chloroflexi bacterium]|nr:carboxylating nicotinate-nucleotide diphosphorylase [Chloroflexota bacterium]